MFFVKNIHKIWFLKSICKKCSCNHFKILKNQIQLKKKAYLRCPKEFDGSNPGILTHKHLNSI